MKKFGGELEFGIYVEEIIVEGEGKEKRATGVRTRDGKVYKVNKVVILNVMFWDMVLMLLLDVMF